MEHPHRPARGHGSESQPPSHWPSQSEIADALDISRARVGQIVTADRTRWSKDPSITPFRHELCEQIQRLGGVVTIPEIIDLTILLRPAANTLETIRQQRMASAVARAAVETEASMALPRFQIRRVAGKVVVSCSPELATYAEELGQKADQLAAADPLPSAAAGVPGTLRGQPAATAPWLSTLQQRATPEARRRHEPDRRRVLSSGALSPWHGGGTSLAAGHRGVVRARSG